MLFLWHTNEENMKFCPTSYMKFSIIYADKAIAETSQQTAPQHVESSSQEGQASEGSENSKLVLRVNDEGRYVCQLCAKTFKTVCLRMAKRISLCSTLLFFDKRMQSVKQIKQVNWHLHFFALCLTKLQILLPPTSSPTFWERICQPTVRRKTSIVTSVAPLSEPRAHWYVTTAGTQVRPNTWWYQTVSSLSFSNLRMTFYSVRLPSTFQMSGPIGAISAASPSESRGPWLDTWSPLPPAQRRSASASARRSLLARMVFVKVKNSFWNCTFTLLLFSKGWALKLMHVFSDVFLIQSFVCVRLYI